VQQPNDSSRLQFYWERSSDGGGSWKRLAQATEGPPGVELASLRRGLGKEPGVVPSMWPFYTTWSKDGSVGHKLRAEHLALTLFALHQQGKRRPMHRHGIRIGSALQEMRRTGRFSEEALDRRFAAAATASSLTELGGHLRGLVSQLRVVDQGLDYSLLFYDLTNWQSPERQGAVRRRWGAQYFVWTPRELRDPQEETSSQPEISSEKEQK